MQDLLKNFNSDKDKPRPSCLHDEFNNKLIESGQVRTIEEANFVPRMIACPCSKCRPSYYGPSA